MPTIVSQVHDKILLKYLTNDEGMIMKKIKTKKVWIVKAD